MASTEDPWITAGWKKLEAKLNEHNANISDFDAQTDWPAVLKEIGFTALDTGRLLKVIKARHPSTRDLVKRVTELEERVLELEKRNTGRSPKKPSRKASPRTTSRKVAAPRQKRASPPRASPPHKIKTNGTRQKRLSKTKKAAAPVAPASDLWDIATDLCTKQEKEEQKFFSSAAKIAIKVTPNNKPPSKKKKKIPI